MRPLRRRAPPGLALLLAVPAWLAAAGPAPARPVQDPPPPAQDTSGHAQLEVRAVRKADQSPVPGVEVWVLYRTEEMTVIRARHRTNDEGRTDPPVKIPPGATIASIAVRPTMETAPALRVLNQVVRTQEKLEESFELEPAVMIAGQVVDELGAGVAGVKVCGWFRERWDVETYPVPELDVFAESNADGYFLLGGIPQGHFTLDVDAPERAAVRRAGGLVRTGQRLEGIVLQLAQAHSVSGQVLAADGKAAASASVLAGKQGRQKRRDESGIADVWYYPSRQLIVPCDSDGLFELERVPVDERWNLLVKCPGHLPHEDVLEPGRSFVEVKLEAGGVLSGVVVDAAGAPQAQAELRLRGDARRRPDSAKGKRETGADGLFRFEGLEPGGTYFLMVHRPGDAVQTLGPYTLEDAPEQIRVVLQPGRFLGGVVQDASGAAVAGAEVSVEPVLDAALLAALRASDVAAAEVLFGLNRTVTTADGRFRLADLGPVRYRLRATAPSGVAALQQELEAGREDLVLSLHGR
ncbi:MAG: carboxypeptidase regulatory-like domain-containing protein [Planctomycetota bacterium]|nr:MAG: carboxypeptidase regulatory-like domain-containing protein [Planctomycetota bacterium]